MRAVQDKVEKGGNHTVISKIKKVVRGGQSDSHLTTREGNIARWLADGEKIREKDPFWINGVQSTGKGNGDTSGK